LRLRDQAGSDRILPHVHRRLDEVFVRAERVIMEAALPKAACAFDCTRCGDEFALEASNELDQVLVLKEEVHMIRHEAPRIQTCLPLLGEVNNERGGLIG